MDGPSTSAHLVMLHVGRTRVALAQRAVRSLEATADVDFSARSDGTLGVIDVGGSRWHVYALDEELAPLRSAPRDRRICALLAAEDGLFALLCDDAQVLPRQALVAYPLPAAMRKAASPVEGVLNLDPGVALLSSSRGLALAAGVAMDDATLQVRP